MLSLEREQELVFRIKTGGLQADQARDELVNAHLRMAVSMARRMKRPGGNVQEMIQEGSIGLLQAVDRFQEERGCRFSTCAWWWVRNALKEYLQQDQGDIHIPFNQKKKIARFTAAIQTLKLEGRSINDESIAQLMKVSVTEVQDIAETRLMMSVVSLSKPVSEDSGELGDLLADTSSATAEQRLVEQEVEDELRDGVFSLPERERRIISMRFGLEGELTRTLEQVGEIYGISKERVRQIEAKALSRLRERM